MTTPRVTVPFEPEGVSPVYSAAYDSIRKGAPGLSDATCAVIARSINMKVSRLSAAPAPEGGAVSIWSDARSLFVRYAELFAMTERYEEASAIADKAAREIETLATREEAPAEGSDDLAARLRHAETWDLDADQEARDRCGVLMLEAAERLENLRAQPQAREEEGGTLDPAFVAWLKERDCLPNDDDGTIEWAAKGLDPLTGSAAAALTPGTTLRHRDGRTGTFVSVEEDGRYRVRSLKGPGFWVFHPADCWPAASELAPPKGSEAAHD